MTATLLAASLLLSSSPADGASVERFQGVARRPDGTVAYVERHEVRRAEGRVASAETRYLRQDGEAIARLSSDYAASPFAPDYEFKDLRTGAREAVRRVASGVELFDGDRASPLEIPDGRPLVTGQGLDRYARAHLQALAGGEVLRVTLALPGRLDAFDFRLRGERTASGTIRVHFEPGSFILRILAPSLEAEYDPASGRLLTYRGVANVAADDGSYQKVEITYSYGEPDAA